MNYKEGLSWLESRKPSLIENSTKTIELLVEKLENPQDKVKCIHIGGTNGKGSVCEYLRSILVKNGYKTGLFISPHIIDIRESIQINHEYIEEDEFLKELTEIRPLVEELDEEGVYASSFEIMVAIAFNYYNRNEVDLAIIEVGLGGRDDATNIIKDPLLEIFTPISMDHLDILGKDLREIAQVKSGIIKENSKVLSSEQESPVVEVLEKKAMDTESSLEFLDDKDIKVLDINSDYSLYNYRKLKNIKTRIHGRHQIYNSALAILAISYLVKYYDFVIDEKVMIEAIEETKNPGRIEKLSSKPLLIVDGSHNKASIDELIDYIKTLSYERLILGFGVLKDKDYNYILENLFPLADEIIITDVNNPRSLDMDTLSKLGSKYKDGIIKISSKEEALKKSLDLVQEDDLVLWCGSFYLIKEIRDLFMK